MDNMVQIEIGKICHDFEEWFLKLYKNPCIDLIGPYPF